MLHENAKEPKMLGRPQPPILMTEKEVRKLLGRLPRDLENMVLADPQHKPERKLFLRSEVMKRCK